MVKYIDAPAKGAAKTRCRVASLAMDDPLHGIEATIIDLGLARITQLGQEGEYSSWTPFDDTVFEGEGKNHTPLIAASY